MKTIFIKLFFLFIFSVSCVRNNNNEIEVINFENTEQQNLLPNNNDNETIYVAISTMISPVETFNLYRDLIEYISKRLEKRIVFKQRKTYEEVNELLRLKQLDFAFICTGAYWQAKKTFPLEILAVPVVNGRPYYNAYIITNKFSGINNFYEFKGKTFAFTDPLSNTGYSYVITLLKNNKTTSEKFFKKTIFTYAHDYSIQAVAKNLVFGASVDGLVYEYLKNFQPEKVQDIVVIQKSEDFVIPPFVVRPDLEQNTKRKLKDIMLNMHNDQQGKGILDRIMIDKFIFVEENEYN